MIVSMNEIETVVAVMFEHSKTDVSHAQCIQYYPDLIEEVKLLTNVANEQKELSHEWERRYLFFKKALELLKNKGIETVFIEDVLKQFHDSSKVNTSET